jgi:hypothetical protein
MVCKTCKLLVAGKCIHLGLPVGNLDPSCEYYEGEEYRGRHMPGSRFMVSDDDDEWDDDYDDEYYDDEEEDLDYEDDWDDWDDYEDDDDDGVNG